MSEMFLVYVLVGFAAAAVGWVLWQGIVDAGEVSSEHLEWGNGIGADGRQKPAIERFVSPGHLLRMRLMSAALPALVVPGLFISAGFMNPVFLATFSAVIAFAGWKIPLVHYRKAVRKRQEAFENSILDLTMSVASALKSGMALPQALERVAGRMKGPMREELKVLLDEYRMGTNLPTAFERLTERMPCEDMRLLTSAIRLTVKAGGSLAEVLSEMTQTIRSRRQFHDKLKSMTALGRVEGIGLGVMPLVALVIFYFIQPDITVTLFKTTAGWCALGVAGLLEFTGFVMVSKICKVEA